MRLLEHKEKNNSQVNDNKELFKRHIELFNKSKLKDGKLKELSAKVNVQYNYKPILNTNSQFNFKNNFLERQEIFQNKIKNKQFE